ncbi:MAG: polysulfide reductase NrfD [Archaeoglobales archaeon]|nr:polysulfide reductase NrfD [Archaeoglobales archaeon]
MATGDSLREAIFVGLMIVLICIGAFGVIQMHTEPIVPIEPFESAIGIPWRLLVATYLFFVLSGLCIIASLSEVFGIKKFTAIADEALILSLVTVVVGLTVIALDLERVERGAYATLGHVNAGSVMFWMIMFYIIEVVLLIIEMWFHFRNRLLKQCEERGLRGIFAKIVTLRFLRLKFLEDERLNHEIAVVMGFATLFTAIIAYSNLGALFAANYLPAWHGPLLPILFVVTAVVTGSSLSIITTVASDWVRGDVLKRYESLQALKFLLGFALIVQAFFVGWKMLITAYPTAGELASKAMAAYITGKFAFNFWIIEVGIGMLIPLLLLVSPAGKSISGILLAAILAITGIIFSRIDLVLGGQVVKLISGVNVGNTPIHPFEVMTAIGAGALVVLLYYVLYKLLPVEVEHEA